MDTYLTGLLIMGIVVGAFGLFFAERERNGWRIRAAQPQKHLTPAATTASRYAESCWECRSLGETAMAQGNQIRALKAELAAERARRPNGDGTFEKAARVIVVSDGPGALFASDVGAPDPLATAEPATPSVSNWGPEL